MGCSAGICLGLAAGVAMSHDGADALAAWYRSLTTADGKSCCSMHDCAPAEARFLLETKSTTRNRAVY